MYAIFVAKCWFNMKPLNRTQPTHLQLCSNQSTSQPQFLVWGERAPKNTFVPSPHICRSVPAHPHTHTDAKNVVSRLKSHKTCKFIKISISKI